MEIYLNVLLYILPTLHFEPAYSDTFFLPLQKRALNLPIFWLIVIGRGGETYRENKYRIIQ